MNCALIKVFLSFWESRSLSGGAGICGKVTSLVTECGDIISWLSVYGEVKVTLHTASCPTKKGGFSSFYVYAVLLRVVRVFGMIFCTQHKTRIPIVKAQRRE